MQSFMTFRACLGPQKCDSFRRIIIIIIIIIIKAASSDERDLAPGLTANGGFRKTANGEQYAFKVINIGGICQIHLYVPNFLLPAGGAMTITGYWHVDVFRPAHLSNI